jgi:pyrimidine nucleoside transport protein
VLQWFVVKIGWLLQVTVGTTAVESLNASANIFLGQATAPFLIRPYLKDLTLSEIHAVMTGGFATIAGTVLAAYISFGVSSAHLVSASVMSAPAALAFAKLFYPETEVSKTKSENIVIEAPKEANVLDAATQGASSAGILVVNITAIVVAFIAFMAFLNSVVAFLGEQVGVPGLSFDIILGKLFIPLTFCMGVEWEDCEKVSRLLGLKTVLNEFIAYRELGKLIDEGALSQRSIVIATYALCGFANPGSIGVQLATLSSMAPERKSDFAAVAFRAFVSGSMACFLTACIAGALYDKQSFVRL